MVNAYLNKENEPTAGFFYNLTKKQKYSNFQYNSLFWRTKSERDVHS